MNKRKYWILSLLTVLAFLLVALATFRDYGMGWDEVTRWRSGDFKVEYYKELFASDEPLEVIKHAGTDRYPGLFDVPLSAFSQWSDWDRFYLGHLLSICYGVIAFVGTWLMGRVMGGGRLAFWSMLFLLLTPSFYGHVFQNPKDVPFAAMYTLAVCALVHGSKHFERINGKSAVLVGLCIGLAMSVRIGGMVLLSYYVALCAACLIRRWAAQEATVVDFMRLLLSERRTLVRWVLCAVVITCVAFFTLMLWWPAGHKNVFSASGDTLQHLHGSAAKIPLFFRGEVMNASDAPWYYTLWMFTIKSPESLLLLLGVFIVGVGRELRFGWKSALSRLSLPGFAVCLGGFFPLLYLTFSAPALHNAERHFLFVFPSLCVLAALGWLRFLDVLREGVWRRYAKWAYILVPVMLLFQFWQLVCLHPYQYIYYNSLIGGTAGSYGRYETEYWFTSSKHGVERLEAYLTQQNVHSTVTKILITGPHQVVERFLPEPFKLTSDLAQADYVIANTQMMMHTLFEGEIVGFIECAGLPILYIYKVDH